MTIAERSINTKFASVEHVPRIIGTSIGPSRALINCIRCTFRNRSACSATNRMVFALRDTTGRVHPLRRCKLKYPYTGNCAPITIHCGWSHWKRGSVIYWVTVSIRAEGGAEGDRTLSCCLKHFMRKAKKKKNRNISKLRKTIPAKLFKQRYQKLKSQKITLNHFIFKNLVF